MTKTAAVAILIVSLAAVTASQLILKARLAPLSEALQPGAPWIAIALKAMSDPYLWIGGLLVVIGGACWYLALTQLPLSLMMPLASVIAPCAAIGAYVFLGEALSLPKIGAILVIMAGVAWLGWLNA